MFPVLVSVGEGKKLSSKILLNPRVPLPHAVACCFYFLITCLGVVKVIPIFATLFDGLGVDVPLLTHFTIATYQWLYPVFFLAAAALTIVKQFVQLDATRLRVTNLFLIFVGAGLVPLTILAMYLPLLELIWKLHHPY